MSGGDQDRLCSDLTLREICEMYRGDQRNPIVPKKIVAFNDRIEIEWPETPVYAMTKTLQLPRSDQ